MIEPQRKNVTFSHRYRWLQRFLDEPNQARLLAELLLRGRLRTRVYGKLRRYNLQQPPPLDAEIRQELTERYRSDIEQLQSLIGRDLSHWLNG